MFASSPLKCSAALIKYNLITKSIVFSSLLKLEVLFSLGWFGLSKLLSDILVSSVGFGLIARHGMESALYLIFLPGSVLVGSEDSGRRVHGNQCNSLCIPIVSDYTISHLKTNSLLQIGVQICTPLKCLTV